MTQTPMSTGIGFGKAIWGGLGQNAFNPALIGRAFLQTAFPVAITTWPTPGGNFFALKGDLFAYPFMHPVSDVVTSATIRIPSRGARWFGAKPADRRYCPRAWP